MKRTTGVVNYTIQEFNLLIGPTGFGAVYFVADVNPCLPPRSQPVKD